MLVALLCACAASAAVLAHCVWLIALFVACAVCPVAVLATANNFPPKKHPSQTNTLPTHYSYRLVKAWAAAHGLNDAAANTFNSWSLGLLVAFYLQVYSQQMAVWWVA